MHFHEEKRKFKVATNTDAKKETVIVKDQPSALYWHKQAPRIGPSFKAATCKYINLF